MSSLVTPLPIIATLHTAFRAVFLGQARNLLPALFFPLLFSIAIALAYGWLSGRVIVGSYKSTLALQFLIWTEPFASAIPYVIFLAAWHRLILSDERPSWRPSWRARHWGLFGYLLLAAIVALFINGLLLVPLQPLLADLQDLLVQQGFSDQEALRYAYLTVQGAISLVFAWFGARLGLVLPARAMDHNKFGLLAAWEYSRGNGLRIMAAGLVVYVVFLAARELVDAAVQGSWSAEPLGTLAQPIDWTAGLGYLALVVPLDYLGVAVAVTVVSLAYRHCAASAPGMARTDLTED